MPVGRDAAHKPADLLRQAALVAEEALAGFGADGGLRQASSLAFYTLLALIPALLLLTFLLGLVLGGSQSAHQKLTGYLAQMVPGQAERMLEAVAALTRHAGTVGVVNTLVLAWSVTPLVAALREIVRGIFKGRETRSLWLVKLLDLGIGMVTLTSLAAVAAAGVVVHASGAALLRLGGHRFSLGLVLPFLVTTVLVAGLLRLYAPRGVRMAHVLAGALTTATLWFLLRPAFTLFLTFDRSYGLAFGSFKSLFIVVIWIYVSMAILLLGVEVAAACHRGDAVVIKRLLEGRATPAYVGRRNLTLDAPAGHVFFREGEPGDEMYFVLAGTVRILKGDHEIARIGPGSFFGEMTFLLGMERSATAAAAEPCQCVLVHARNFAILMREFPDTLRTMLVEMASRLRDTSAKSRPAETPEPEVSLRS